MPGLLRGLYWCPARLQGKLELSRHFLQEAFSIKKLSFQYVTLLVIYLPIYLCLSIHCFFFCQEHLNKTCSYSHHDSKQSTQLNWLKIFCCESFQHEIEFPPGRSPRARRLDPAVSQQLQPALAQLWVRCSMGRAPPSQMKELSYHIQFFITQ